MKATTLADNTFQISMDQAEVEGFCLIAEDLVQYMAGVTASPRNRRLLAATREVAKGLVEGAIRAKSSSIHPDMPAVLRELDIRRGELPVIDCPKQYAARSACAAAFHEAYEIGFRGWPKPNEHRRQDCRNAWEEGRAAGQSKFRNLLAGSSGLRSEAYINGFNSGWHGLRKDSPYWDGDNPVFDGHIEYHRTWLKGYESGWNAFRFGRPVPAEVKQRIEFYTSNHLGVESEPARAVA
jgi:hypothetical protein